MIARSIPIEDNLQRSYEAGWHAALYISGLRDCTIRNDSESVMRFPIGRHECYLELGPGEQATLRTVEASEWRIASGEANAPPPLALPGVRAPDRHQAARP